MIKINTINLIHGDCLEKMKQIEDKSIDMICCDLPYGTTSCSWDTVIPFESLWQQYKRIIKDKGNIILFGSQPFTTLLINSNLSWFRYCCIWNKKLAGNGILAKIQPLKIHEDICVFYKDLNEVKNSTENYKELRNYFKEIQEYIGLNIKQINTKLLHRKAEHCFYWKSTQWGLPTEDVYNQLIEVFNINESIKFRIYEELKELYDKESEELNNFTYNPQMTKGKARIKNGIEDKHGIFNNAKSEQTFNDTYYPTSIIEVSNAGLRREKVHPTQKPVELIEYLINTYSNKGQTILDNAMGSCSTGIACVNTKRNFIGIELDNTYFETCKNRVNTYIKENNMQDIHIEIAE